MSLTVRARALAKRTEDAYSADRYRSWAAVARAILVAGYDDEAAETVLRSKVTRWAADCSDASYGRVPTSAIEDYLASDANRVWLRTYLLEA